MSSEWFDVLIVGSGHAGAQAAVALRQQKYEGSIAIVGEEPEIPYERPPLSKDYLAGTKAFERIQIRPESFWVDRKVRLLRGRRVVAVDPADHIAWLEDGAPVLFGKLIWAAGGHARRLNCQGHDLAGVHTVRSKTDVDRIVGELEGTQRVAVIGGGYIGLETAAVLSKLGKHVTVLEAQDRVLARVAGEPLSRFYEAEHRAQGVDVRLNTTLECIEGRQGRVAGVRLTDGEFITAEMVVVGIGIVPAVEPLLEAGALGSNGVAVDRFGLTSLPDVYAVGDCALHHNAYADGRQIRLESVQNANDMAVCAAKHICGGTEPYHSVPWFWSFQYDLHLQTVGLCAGHDEVVVRGDPAARSFGVVYLLAGRVLAIDCVNAPRDFVQGKALVTGRRLVNRETVADVSVPLKTLA